jgi:hypothetical protein
MTIRELVVYFKFEGIFVYHFNNLENTLICLSDV